MDNINKLDKMFNDLLAKFPKKKKELVKEAGDLMYEQVINNINSSVKENSGKLKEGVTKAVGSKGGYVAIRPDYKIAPHTNLIENGHNVVRGGEIIGWANGKHMYRNALEQASDQIIDKAEKMIDDLVGDVDD
ncbi:MAG: hypothetical protein N4A63_12910 [Vallitalea sp.]|jgi:hypothetical protein|nr:hypothetical protein [Vallitalea sp.]